MGMALIFCLPLLRFKSFPFILCQDTAFHLTRLAGLANVWTSPVHFTVYKMNGLMLNPFYPWQTLYPAFVLGKILGSIGKGFWTYCQGQFKNVVLGQFKNVVFGQSFL